MLPHLLSGHNPYGMANLALATSLFDRSIRENQLTVLLLSLEIPL